MLQNIIFWIIIIILPINIFFAVLNDFLKGSWKQYIDSVIGLFAIIIFLSSIIFLDWSTTLFLFISTFIYSAAMLSVAKRLASGNIKSAAISFVWRTFLAYAIGWSIINMQTCNLQNIPPNLSCEQTAEYMTKNCQYTITKWRQVNIDSDLKHCK